MTGAGRASAFAALEERRATLARRLSTATDAQLAFRPSTRSWSWAQVAEHLLLVEEVALRAVMRTTRRPARRGLLAGTRRWVVRATLRSRIRIPAPVRAVLPQAAPRLVDTLQRWERLRSQWMEHLATLEAAGDASRDALVFTHFIGGPMTLDETLEFLVDHFDHHLPQLDRIQRAPGFPPDRIASVR